MPLSVVAHNRMLDDLGADAVSVGLLQATTLAADVLAGATTVDVNHEVAVGDYISLNESPNRETFEVTAVSGTGPYTATLDVATVNAYGANTYVGHAPKDSAQVREATGASYSRQSITWNVAATENLDSSNTPSFSVEGGNAVGGFMLWSGGATPVFLGSALTNSIEVFGAEGTYDLTDADVNLSS